MRRFYTSVCDCHWDYKVHNNYKIVNICVGREAELVKPREPRK